MFAVLAKILGSGDVVSKSLDLIDSMHTSGEEAEAAKSKARVDLLAAYQPFRLAQRYLALMFSAMFLFIMANGVVGALYGVIDMNNVEAAKGFRVIDVAWRNHACDCRLLLWRRASVEHQREEELGKTPDAIAVIDLARGVFHPAITKRVSKTARFFAASKAEAITNRKPIDLVGCLRQPPHRRDLAAYVHQSRQVVVSSVQRGSGDAVGGRSHPQPNRCRSNRIVLAVNARLYPGRASDYFLLPSWHCTKHRDKSRISQRPDHHSKCARASVDRKSSHDTNRE